MTTEPTKPNEDEEPPEDMTEEERKTWEKTRAPQHRPSQTPYSGNRPTQKF